jgi:glutamine amidotransferase
MAADIVIVDYGMGNLWSVRSALRYLGVEPVISDNASRIEKADLLLLPGVGSFRKAIQALKKKDLDKAIKESVLGRKRKILGICLGMQLFAERGMEDGDSDGLAFIPGSVERFTNQELGMLKVPHIGFNNVHSTAESILFRSIESPSDFYFVHSYRLLPGTVTGKLGICRYGVDFMAAYENENIFATQFHPEKSQTNGLILLRNFLIA